MKNEKPPLAWVRKVDAALQMLDKIPLYGNAPRFDIDKISQLIASHFSPGLSIEIDDCSWRETAQIKEGLGSNAMMLNLAISPIGGDAIWIMDSSDVARLTSFLMNGKTRGKSISSEILQEGFYRYLVLQALDVLQGVEPLKQLTLKISDESSPLAENAYCIDVKISYDERAVWGRIVLPARFMTAWQHHFSSMRELFSPSPLAKSLEVSLGLCTGSVQLTAKEWKKLEIGDFILLDRGGFDPRHQEGLATISLGDSKLFHVTVKENKIKLLDYALAYEEKMENIAPVETAEKGSAEEEREMAIKDIPLMVTVELARLRMTVDELMKLTPGNFLELPIKPNQEVALTVQGQKIGRGELVYLGEALGVRILETAEG
jgi:flagellar motor switch protein FliN